MDVAKEVSKSLSERIVIAKVFFSYIQAYQIVRTDGESLGQWRTLGFRKTA
jgi:hypothetical protein